MTSDPPGNNVSRARWSRRIPGVMTSEPASPTRAVVPWMSVAMSSWSTSPRTLSEPGTAVDARAWICCLRALAVASPSRRSQTNCANAASLPARESTSSRRRVDGVRVTIRPRAETRRES